MGLTDNQASVPMVAADKDDVDSSGLHLRKQHGILCLARGKGLVQGDPDATVAQPSPRAVGDALAPDRAVVEDRNPLPGPTLDQVFGHHFALPIVPAAHPE